MWIINTQTHYWRIISCALCCQLAAAVIGRLVPICLCRDYDISRAARLWMLLLAVMQICYGMFTFGFSCLSAHELQFLLMQLVFSVCRENPPCLLLCRCYWILADLFCCVSQGTAHSLSLDNCFVILLLQPHALNYVWEQHRVLGPTVLPAADSSVCVQFLLL